MRHFLFIACLLAPLWLSAQAQPASREAPKGKEASPAPLNQTNSKGQRHGMWWIEQPARMGEEAYLEFGTYDAGRKFGLWYKIDGQGEIVAIETYRNNVLDGESKYFEGGRLIAVGNYRGLNPARPYDTIVVVDPRTGLERLRPVATEKGTMRHGLWRFYDPQTGRLVREEEYQVDEVIARKEFQLTSTDSAYFRQRVQALPHNRKGKYAPPSGKQIQYADY